MSVASHYTGEEGARYLAYQIEGAAGAHLNARKFQPYIKPADTVVDFGCGAGFMLEHLAAPGPSDEPRIAIRRIGVEPNEHARTQAIERGLRVVASPAELPSATADLVVSNHALEHTLNPFGELLELRRVLKPHGRLVLYLPLHDWRADRKVLDDPNHHLYGWTTLLLRNLLEEAGFDVRVTRVVTYAWPQPLRRWVRLPRFVFDRLAVMWSIVTRRRQVMAVCTRPPG